MGNLVGNCCEKILQEMLREIVVGKSCRKFLQENLVGIDGGNSVRNLVANAMGHPPYLSPSWF